MWRGLVEFFFVAGPETCCYQEEEERSSNKGHVCISNTRRKLIVVLEIRARHSLLTSEVPFASRISTFEQETLRTAAP
jgi:hypothetical protein